MKRFFERLASAAMAVVLACGMVAVPAFADTTDSAGGAITVSGLPSTEATTVSAYQLVKYDESTYSWALTELVTNAISADSSTSLTAASALSTLTSSSSSSSELAAVLSVVADYVDSNGSTVTADATATTSAGEDGAYSTSVTLNVSEVGSYLIIASGGEDSDYTYNTMLASNYSTTTNGSPVAADATVTAKSSSTEVSKSVDDAEVAVGDTVSYTVATTFPNYEGSSNFAFVVTDSMDSKLSLVTNGTALAASDITVQVKSSSADEWTTLSNSSDTTVYTVSSTVEGDDDFNGFVLTFDSSWLAVDYATYAGYDVQLTYSATVTGYNSTNSYTNTVTVNALSTYSASATVYTAALTLKKIDADSTDSNGLSGAVFTITTTKGDDSEGATVYYVVQASDGTISYVTEDELSSLSDSSTYQFTTGTDGTVSVSGLDPDYTYTLAEATAPSGYTRNTSTPTIAFTASAGDAGAYTATLSGGGSYWNVSPNSEDSTATAATTVTVTLSDSMLGSLPSTGDNGMFVLVGVGVVLMASCGIALVALRKRGKAAAK